LTIQQHISTISSVLTQKTNRKDFEGRVKTILAKVASQGNQIQAVKRQQHKYKSDTSKVTTAQQIYNNDITTKLASATSDVAP